VVWETVAWVMGAVCVCVCACVCAGACVGGFVRACAHTCTQGVYKLNSRVVSILQCNTQKMLLAYFKEFGSLSRTTC